MCNMNVMLWPESPDSSSHSISHDLATRISGVSSLAHDNGSSARTARLIRQQQSKPPALLSSKKLVGWAGLASALALHQEVALGHCSRVCVSAYFPLHLSNLEPASRSRLVYRPRRNARPTDSINQVLAFPSPSFQYSVARRVS